jgi:hypothetical protein
MNGLIKLLTKLSVYYCRNPDDLIGWEAHSFRSYLKIRIFVRDQGETETQPAGIL